MANRERSVVILEDKEKELKELRDLLADGMSLSLPLFCVSMTYWDHVHFSLSLPFPALPRPDWWRLCGYGREPTDA